MKPAPGAAPTGGLWEAEWPMPGRALPPPRWEGAPSTQHPDLWAQCGQSCLPRPAGGGRARARSASEALPLGRTLPGWSQGRHGAVPLSARPRGDLEGQFMAQPLEAEPPGGGGGGGQVLHPFPQGTGETRPGGEGARAPPSRFPFSRRNLSSVYPGRAPIRPGTAGALRWVPGPWLPQLGSGCFSLLMLWGHLL